MKMMMETKLTARKEEENKKRESSEPRDQRPGPGLKQALAPHDADDLVARVVGIAAAAGVVVVVAAAAVSFSPPPFRTSTSSVPDPPSFLFQDRKRLLQVEKGALEQMVAHDELDAAVWLFCFELLKGGRGRVFFFEKS